MEVAPPSTNLNERLLLGKSLRYIRLNISVAFSQLFFNSNDKSPAIQKKTEYNKLRFSSKRKGMLNMFHEKMIKLSKQQNFWIEKFFLKFQQYR